MSQLFNNYSLAVEEIKLSNSLKNLSNLVNNFDGSDKPKYLLEEVAYLERRLRTIRGKRSDN